MNRPALKLAVFFVLGILLGRTVDVPIPLLLGLTASLLLFICIYSLHKKISDASIYLSVGLLVVCSACLHFELRTSHFSPLHITRFLDHRQQVELTGKIVSLPEVEEERTWFVLDAIGIRLGDRYIGVEGKVQVTVGERSDRFCCGDVVSLKAQIEEPQGQRNPGGFDYRSYLNRMGIYGLVRMQHAQGVDVLRREGVNVLLSSVIWPVKRSMRRTIEGHLSGAPAALLKGLLLGEGRSIPPAVKTAFQQSGVVHVLVVSGLHVGLVFFIFFNLFRAFRLPFKWAVGFTLGVLLLYAFLMDLRPPVVRASVMAAVFLIGWIIQRNVDTLNTIAVAGLVILMCSPQALFDPGFQLSFAAVISIAYCYPRLKGWLPRSLQQQHTWWRRWLIGGALVSLSAQLGVAPIVVHLFYLLPIISVAANLVVVPAVGLILCLGFAAALFGPVCPSIAFLFNACNYLVLSGLLHVVSLFASLPAASLYLPPPSLLFCIGYYLIVSLGVNGRRSKKARRWLVMALLLMANLCVWNALFTNHGDRLTVTFLDVGHGDAVFIRSPGGQTLLIDGGRKSSYADCGEKVLKPFLLHSGVRTLEAVMMTHPHSDHLGGLLTVINQWNVKRVLDAGLSYQSNQYSEYVHLIENKNIPRQIVKAGDAIEGFAPLRLVILHPTDKYAAPDGQAPYGLNNGSVVLRLAYKKVSFLFLADVEHEAEEVLLRNRNLLKATVVKVPHQGSHTGSTWELVEAMSPSVAVVSVAEGNRFGHPAKEVVERYEAIGAAFYRTDRDGAVVISTDGEEIEVWTMTGEGPGKLQNSKIKIQNSGKKR